MKIGESEATKAPKEPICMQTVAVFRAMVNDLQIENWLKIVQLIESDSQFPELMIQPSKPDKALD